MQVSSAGCWVQGKRAGPAQNGALVGNGNPEADAEAAQGPNARKAEEPSNGAPSRIADGWAEDMENGQAGPAGGRPSGNKPAPAQSGKRK